MKAALLTAAHLIEFTDVPTPSVPADHVLIDVEYVGLCGSDVELYNTNSPALYPVIPGHEMVGRVAMKSSVFNRTLEIGKRVVLEPNYPCGICGLCRSGRGNLCQHRIAVGITAPGCLAEYVSAPTDFVWPIPDSVDPLDAVGIEPAAVAYHALRIAGALMGNAIGVVGAGMIGTLLINIASLFGLDVLACDQHESRLTLALQAGAKECCLVENDDSALEKSREMWERFHVETIFDCSGSASGLQLALQTALPGSQIVLVGMANVMHQFSPMDFVLRGLKLIGAPIYDHPRDFSATIALVTQGTFRPGQFVTKRFPFRSIREAFELAVARKEGKIVIELNGT